MTSKLSPKTLVVGIGSANGDDRVGHCIAELLATECGSPVEVRVASVPADLLDWLDGVDQLIVCDACRSKDPAGTITGWRWPTPEIAQQQFSGSHDLPLPAVLELARGIGRLPPRVTIWGVTIADARPTEAMSPEVAAAVPAVVSRIRLALGQA